MGYTCSCCGGYHDEVPTAYGADAPIYYEALPEHERSERMQLSSDTAILDGEHFFIRGRIEIPVAGHSEPFAWGVWISMDQEDFERALELWDTPGREASLPESVGYISTSLPIYPDTVNLFGRIHHRAVGERPYIELEPTEHPLSVEQRTGITWARVEEIASQMHAAGRRGR